MKNAKKKAVIRKVNAGIAIYSESVIPIANEMDTGIIPVNEGNKYSLEESSFPGGVLFKSRIRS